MADSEGPVDVFLGLVGSEGFIKATLSKPAKRGTDSPDNVYLRPVVIKGERQLSWTMRHAQRDETKNFSPDESLQRLRALLGSHFLRADVFCEGVEATLFFNRRGEASLKQKRSESASTEQPSGHDRVKHRMLDAAAPWLQLLGLADSQGRIYAAAQDKWRQINKYAEIIDGIAETLPHRAKIADMGCGKGYLTFALYDLLANKRGRHPLVTGVELRPALVAQANANAQAVGFENLKFQAGSIEQWQPDHLDLLIALHACDTATDLAIAAGVRAGAQTIVVAPCCHKQIRKEMRPQGMWEGILKHGILAERHAELLTDGIRALLLETCGYKTRVFEFISLEHTSKNVMIVAEKAPTSPPAKAQAMEKIAALKSEFGISCHRLEELLAGA